MKTVCVKRETCEYPKCRPEDHGKDRIICHGYCGEEIPHHQDSLSIGHRCLACNVEDGKGE